MAATKERQRLILKRWPRWEIEKLLSQKNAARKQDKLSIKNSKSKKRANAKKYIKILKCREPSFSILLYEVVFNFPRSGTTFRLFLARCFH